MRECRDPLSLSLLLNLVVRWAWHPPRHSGLSNEGRVHVRISVSLHTQPRGQATAFRSVKEDRNGGTMLPRKELRVSSLTTLFIC